MAWGARSLIDRISEAEERRRQAWTAKHEARLLRGWGRLSTGLPLSQLTPRGLDYERTRLREPDRVRPTNYQPIMASQQAKDERRLSSILERQARAFRGEVPAGMRRPLRPGEVRHTITSAPQEPEPEPRAPVWEPSHLQEAARRGMPGAREAEEQRIIAQLEAERGGPLPPDLLAEIRRGNVRGQGSFIPEEMAQQLLAPLPLGPVRGPAERYLSAAATPLGIAGMATGPLQLGLRGGLLSELGLGAGSIGAGAGAEALNAPPAVQIGAEIGGGLLGASPGVLGGLGRRLRFPSPRAPTVIERTPSVVEDTFQPTMRPTRAGAAREIAEEGVSPPPPVDTAAGVSRAAPSAVRPAEALPLPSTAIRAETGEPITMRLFRGETDAPPLAPRRAAFWATRPRLASAYAGESTGARVTMLDATFQNPLVLPSKYSGETRELLGGINIAEVKLRTNGDAIFDRMIEDAALARGHDAVIFQEGEGSMAFAATGGSVMDLRRLRAPPKPAEALPPAALDELPPQFSRYGIWDAEEQRIIWGRELYDDALEASREASRSGDMDVLGAQMGTDEPGHDAIAYFSHLRSGQGLGDPLDEAFGGTPHIRIDKDRFTITYDPDGELRNRHIIAESEYQRNLDRTVRRLQQDFPDKGIDIPETREVIAAARPRVPPAKRGAAVSGQEVTSPLDTAAASRLPATSAELLDELSVGGQQRAASAAARERAAGVRAAVEQGQADPNELLRVRDTLDDAVAAEEVSRIARTESFLKEKMDDILARAQDVCERLP